MQWDTKQLAADTDSWQECGQVACTEAWEARCKSQGAQDKHTHP